MSAADDYYLTADYTLVLTIRHNYQLDIEKTYDLR
jgi:hypothetical protein